MFDLTAQNKALQVMKLKSYLEMDPLRWATWAYVTDATFVAHDKLTSKVTAGSHVNMFLQDFAPKMSDLPTRHKDMINVVRKYGLRFDTFDPLKEIKEQLPLFHHFAEDKAASQ